MRRLLKITGGILRNPNSSKYYIEQCSPEWIHIENEIKYVEYERDIDIQKSQLLKAIMNHKEIIVKIGENTDLDNEYKIATKIKKYKGFIKFICFFTCRDNFREFFKGKRKTLCKGSGPIMKTIVMPYYPLGSIGSYPWAADTIGVLRSCLYVACLCYMDAFDSIGFVHNDFHAANILLKETSQTSLTFSNGLKVPLYGLRPWIMDFEKSVVGEKTARRIEDFRYDLCKLFFLLPSFISFISLNAVLNIGSYIANRDTLWEGIERCVVIREG